MKHVEFVEGALPTRKNGNTTFIAWFDDHFPHNRYFDAKLQVLKDEQPDYLILGGDMLNMDPFNPWAEKSMKMRKAKPVAKEYYKQANEEFFALVRQATGKATTIVYILGNHEHWAHRAVEDFPEVEGLIEAEYNVDSDYVDAFVDCKKGVALGDLWFYHGDNIKYSVNKCRKMAQLYHRSIMFGHYHDYEVFAPAVAVDEKPITLVSVPCSTDTNPASYGKNLPTNRSEGFGWGVIREDGDFDVFVSLIRDKQFVYKGKRYVSRDEAKVLPFKL